MEKAEKLYKVKPWREDVLIRRCRREGLWPGRASEPCGLTGKTADFANRGREESPKASGLAVARAATGAVGGRWRQRVHLCSVIEHPPLMVMEQAAVVVIHVEARG